VSETNNPRPTDGELWNALRPKTKEAAVPPLKATGWTWRGWLWIGVAVVLALVFLAFAVLFVIAAGLMATA
jgi:hypothetical protein